MSENESEEEDEEDEDDNEEPRSKTVAIGDQALAARWTKCENCNETFGLTTNERGDCNWHSEEKMVDYAAEIWENHDSELPQYFLRDNDWFQEGFIFPCCDVGVGDECCKVTKHKAKANKHINSRFDEEKVSRIVCWSKCANCWKGFDFRSEKPNTCIFHPGSKTMDWDGDFWADHDEDCHGLIDSFTDDPDFEDGFMWDCCKGEIGSEGCIQMGQSEEVYRQRKRYQ